MHTDFTPRKFFATTPGGGGMDPNEEIRLVEKLTELYQKNTTLNDTQIRQRVEMNRLQGTLNKEIEIYQERVDQIAFKSEYIFKSFKDTTAELKNQNILLNISKSAFKKLSDIASDINYFSRGSIDLTDKQLRKMSGLIKMREDDLKAVRDRYEAEKNDKEAAINRLQSQQNLTNSQRERLGVLLKEQEAYKASKNALEELLPVLKNELQFSKDIAKTRESLGGLATAAAKTLGSFGGSLSQFLDITDAAEAVEEYNKTLINRALEKEKVIKALHENEKLRIAAEHRLEIAAEKDREAILQEIAKINQKDLEIRQEAIKKADTFINKFKSLGPLLTNLGTGFKKALLDPTTIITFFIGRALEANKQAVETGRSLGISANAASKLRENYIGFSAAVKDSFINQTRLNKAQNELVKSTGLSVAFREKDLATFARLTELSGLSTQEAGRLQAISAVTNKDYEKYLKNVRATAYAASVSTKQNITGREVLQTISKLSAGILIKFQGNTTALTQTIVEAKKLGLTLEQIDKVGESLLNFESSIENELKAELITGRELNLERARAAALSGDQLSLTREIADQVGSLEDYQNMNVIAQKSLAEAFGLSREEMSEMLIQQKLINTYGEDATKLTKAQREEFERLRKSNKNLTLTSYLEQQEQQLNIQDKFNNAIIKLQELIGGLVEGPLSRIIDNLTVGLNVVVKMFSFFSKIASVIKGLFGAKIGGMLGDFASVLSVGAIMTLVASSITKGTIINPMVVTPIGGMGGIGGMFSRGGLFGKILFPFAKAGATGGVAGAAGAAGTAGAAGGVAGAAGTAGAAGGAAGAVTPATPKPSVTGTTSRGVSVVKKPTVPTTTPTPSAPTPTTPPATPPSSPTSGGGFKGFFSKVKGGLKSLTNPKALFGKYVQNLGGPTGLLKRFLKLGPIAFFLEGIFANSDIQSMIADPTTDKTKLNQMVGARVAKGIGSVVGGAALGALLSEIPGGTIVGGMLGSWLGGNLGNYLAEQFGAEGLGKFVLNSFYKKEMAIAEGKSPEISGLAEGGTVLKTGLAQVDKGEVYLGRNTKETFRILASNSIVQTQYLKDLPSVILNPLNNISLPIVNALNKINFVPLTEAVKKITPTVIPKIDITPIANEISKININPPPVKETIITPTNNIDINSLIAATKEVKAEIANLQNRPIQANLYLDGRKIQESFLQINNTI